MTQRIIKYPSWSDWQSHIIDLVKTSLLGLKVAGVRGLTGADDALQVQVLGPDDVITDFPFVKTYLSGVVPDWDENGSNDYIGSVYTSLGGKNLVQSVKPRRERVSFTIDVYSQRQDQLLDIYQAIWAYISPVGQISVNYLDATVVAYYKMGEGIMEIREVNDKGTIEYFRNEWTIELQILSAGSANDSLVTSIDKTILETEHDIGQGSTNTQDFELNG